MMCISVVRTLGGCIEDIFCVIEGIFGGCRGKMCSLYGGTLEANILLMIMHDNAPYKLHIMSLRPPNNSSKTQNIFSIQTPNVLPPEMPIVLK